MKTPDFIFEWLFSQKIRHSVERIILLLAVSGFLIHVALILLNHVGWLPEMGLTLIDNPVHAIYTPFSLVLLYEFYLLIFYIPRSFTTSFLKQCEIIALILIRRIFGDFTKIDLTLAFSDNTPLQFLLIDLVGVIGLFFIIFLFNRNRGLQAETGQSDKMIHFISIKRLTSLILLTIFVLILSWHIGTIFQQLIHGRLDIDWIKSDLNKVFYDDLFTVLILVDVFILLISFRISESFHYIMRNTGFVVSTIMFRISFGAEGFLNIMLILAGALFSLGILLIYNASVKAGLSD